jgi:hypothetical protein
MPDQGEAAIHGSARKSVQNKVDALINLLDGIGSSQRTRAIKTTVDDKDLRTCLYQLFREDDMKPGGTAGMLLLEKEHIKSLEDIRNSHLEKAVGRCKQLIKIKKKKLSRSDKEILNWVLKRLISASSQYLEVAFKTFRPGALIIVIPGLNDLLPDLGFSRKSAAL